VPNVSRILVPIDFSPSSRVALEYATWLAGRLSASVEVLHVWESGGYVGPEALALLPVAAGQPGWEQTRADVEREVQRFLQASQVKPLSVGVWVEPGEPTEAILAAVKTTGANLIVMGTHGRTGLSRVLLGSVAEAVLRRASCPVLTVRVPQPITTPPAPPL
jgi:nucleotide-binding universal stress UspA family protein